MGDITQLVNGRDASSTDASGDTFRLVYGELRRIAAARLSREQPGHTLQPTALVHEAWMRLANQIQASAWDSRGHFFAAAAEAMRRILIDRARRKSATKRRPDQSAWSITHAVPLPELSADELMDLDAAIDLLSKTEPETAGLIRLRLFAGLSVEEAAEIMQIPVRTAYREWRFGQAWLFRRLGPQQDRRTEPASDL